MERLLPISFVKVISVYRFCPRKCSACAALCMYLCSTFVCRKQSTLHPYVVCGGLWAGTPTSVLHLSSRVDQEGLSLWGRLFKFVGRRDLSMLSGRFEGQYKYLDKFQYRDVVIKMTFLSFSSGSNHLCPCQVTVPTFAFSSSTTWTL